MNIRLLWYMSLGTVSILASFNIIYHIAVVSTKIYLVQKVIVYMKLSFSSNLIEFMLQNDMPWSLHHPFCSTLLLN